MARVVLQRLGVPDGIHYLRDGIFAVHKVRLQRRGQGRARGYIPEEPGLAEGSHGSYGL